MRQKLLLALTFAMSTLCSFAQSDDDWQIGGGRDENSTTYADPYSPTEDVAYTKSSGLFGSFKQSPWSLNVSYINKNWATKMNGTTMHENFFGEPDKRLHGFSIGGDYQPTLNFGLGIHTGLHVEIYVSTSDYVKEKDFDDFTEVNFYVPLHAAFRIPIARRCALSLYAGLGLNYAINGSYREHRYYYDSFTGDWEDHPYTVDQRYGNGWPNRINAATEFGGSLNIKSFRVGIIYSRGITNHHLHPHEEFNSRQNKLQLSIGCLIGDW